MTKPRQEGYCPYPMQVRYFLKRKNCKVSLHFAKYVKSKKPGSLSCFLTINLSVQSLSAAEYAS